jgi:small subunit ribosomal protein S4
MKIGPKYKICRRLGDRVFSKCQTTKFTVSGLDAKNKSGKSKRRRRGVSEYGSQLLEKQKARYTYGINEKQFSNYIKTAREKISIDSILLLNQLLESRLDNVVYRLGLVGSRRFARQIVSHGHVMVNNRRVNIPSFQVKAGNKISIRPQSVNKGIFSDLEERQKNYVVPEWLSFDPDKKTGQVKSLPVTTETNLNFSSILEFYSRV